MHPFSWLARARARAAERAARAFEESGPCAYGCGVYVQPHRGVRQDGAIFCSQEHADSYDFDRTAW